MNQSASTRQQAENVIGQQIGYCISCEHQNCEHPKVKALPGGNCMDWTTDEAQQIGLDEIITVEPLAEYEKRHDIRYAKGKTIEARLTPESMG